MHKTRKPPRRLSPRGHKHPPDAESKMLAPERLVVKNPRNGATYVARCGNSSYPRCASRPRDVAQPALFHPFPAAAPAAIATYVPRMAGDGDGLGGFTQAAGPAGATGVRPRGPDWRPNVHNSTTGAGSRDLAELRTIITRNTAMCRSNSAIVELRTSERPPRDHPQDLPAAAEARDPDRSRTRHMRRTPL